MAAFTRYNVQWEPQLRAALRLSLEPGAERPLLRQGQAVRWIEDALAPLGRTHPNIDRHELAVAIRSATGIEALTWLHDIAGQSPPAGRRHRAADRPGPARLRAPRGNTRTLTLAVTGPEVPVGSARRSRDCGRVAPAVSSAARESRDCRGQIAERPDRREVAVLVYLPAEQLVRVGM